MISYTSVLPGAAQEPVVRLRRLETGAARWRSIVRSRVMGRKERLAAQNRRFRWLFHTFLTWRGRCWTTS